MEEEEPSYQDPEHMDPDEMEEVRQMEHNRRFQAAVLRTMDTQLSQLETQLLTQEADLISSERAREDMALSFLTVKRELIKIKQNSDKQNKEYQEAVSKRKMLENQMSTLTFAFDKKEAENERLLKEVRNEKDMRIRAQNEASSIKQIHSVFTNEMIVYKQLNENLLKEVENAAKKEGKEDERVEKLNKMLKYKSEELYQNKIELMNQENETKKAQIALERCAHELKMTTEAKKLLTTQWEKATRAMSQRDEATSMLEHKRKKAEDELLIAKQTEQTLLSRNESLQTQLERLISIQEKSQHAVTEALSEFSREKMKADDQHKHIQTLTSEIEAVQAELKRSEKHLNHFKSIAVNQRNRELEFREEKKEMKQKMLKEAALGEKTVRDNIRQVENREKNIQKENKQITTRLITVENERQTEKYKSLELEREVNTLGVENTTLIAEMKSMIQKHNSAQNHIHSLEDDVERLTYRANKAEAEVETLQIELRGQAQAVSAQLSSELTRLSTQLKDKKSQYEAINSAFVRTQAHVVSAQHTLGQFNDKTRKLESELTIVTNVNEQYHAEIKRLQERVVEQEKELALIRLDLKKQHDKMIIVQDENLLLKKKIEDSAFAIQAKQAEHDKEVKVLHASLYKQNTEKVTTSHNMIKDLTMNNDRTMRRYEEMAFKYNNLKSENDMLAQKLFQLKSELQKTQKTHVEADRQYHQWAGQFEAIFAREVKDRTTKLRNVRETARFSTTLPNLLKEHDKLRSKEGVPQLAKRAAKKAMEWSSQQSDNTRYIGPQSARSIPKKPKNRTEQLFHNKNASSQARKNKFADTLVHELRKELNRVSTIAAERLNEIVGLKQNLKELSATSMYTQEQKSTFQHAINKSVREKGQVEHELMITKNKYMRACSLAASLERQLAVVMAKASELQYTVANANKGVTESMDFSIDLRFSPDLEPSLELKEVIEDVGSTKARASLHFQNNAYEDRYALSTEDIANQMNKISISKFIQPQKY